MEKAFIEKMEQELLAQQQEIVDKLRAGGSEFTAVNAGLEPKDEVDTAADEIDRKMLEAVGSQDMKRFKLIDGALTRIRTGKYGICVKCGKPISQARLEVMPYATMCVDCKAKEERRFH
jgi:RNA polymerase-binding protein DksA